MSSLTTTIQTASIAVSFLAAGGIATLSLSDVPILQAQPASRSLPSARWLFSRGSHIFPTAAVISGAGLTFLALKSLPPVAVMSRSALLQILESAANSPRVRGYLGAAVLNVAIAPWTSVVMIPNNLALIKMNEEKGGVRSARSARVAAKSGAPAGQRSADDSVSGKGEAEELTDVTGPQEKTTSGTTREEDEKVRGMLALFKAQNLVRAVLMTTGGVLGLATALA